MSRVYGWNVLTVLFFLSEISTYDSPFSPNLVAHLHV